MAHIKSIDQHTLLQHCLHNKEWAQKELYDLHSAELYALCTRYAVDTNEAKDILQEGFIKIFTYIKQYNSTGSLIGWMKKIMVHTALNYIKKYRINIIEDIETATNNTINTNSTNSNSEVQHILYAFMQLPYNYRVVVGLNVIDGYTYAEISNQLQITENNCRIKIHRGKQMLQALLTNNSTLKINNNG